MPAIGIRPAFNDKKAVNIVTPLTITIPGPPIAKARPRFAKVGNYVKTYTPKTTANYENLVKLAFMAGVDPCWQPLTGAVEITVTAYFQRPKSHYGTGRNSGMLKLSAPDYMLTKPDIDNLAKSILDALNGIAYEDDKQVVSMVVHKMYGVMKTVVTLKDVSADE